MTRPAKDLTLPHTLGPYRLERALGQGGMGIVYEAYDRRLDRKVAIKRLLQGQDDPKWRARLRREARTTAQLDHPAVVQIFDLVEDTDGDWIVMERLHGSPLATLLEEGPLDVDATLDYARQIAKGLVAAHDLDIIHRDLKTENVMILPDGRVKVLDFGIAKYVGLVDEGSRQRDLSKTGLIVGTGRAMSPEQARGLSVGPRSDLFSLGILLYECLTGVSPFHGANPVDTLARIVSHQPQPVEELAPAVPEGLAKLVARLLSKAPELRPASAEEVERSLGRLIEERASSPSELTRSAVDEQQTVAATGTMPRRLLEETRGTQKSGHFSEAWSFSESAFGVSKRSNRTALLVVLGAVAAVVAVIAFTLWRPVAETGAVGPSVSRPVDKTPAQRYEETLRALRRLDEPGIADRAITVFREMIERDPKSATAHAGLARAYLEKGRSASSGGDPVFLEQALAIAQEAVRLNSYLADARVSLGLVLSALGRHDEAEEQLQSALELEPTHAGAYYGLGKRAEAISRFAEAVDHYRRAVELRPAPLYFNALGAVLYDLGRYDEAGEAFEETLAISPNDLNALRNLGGIYYAQGRLEEAASKLQAALKIRPNASLFSNLGTVLFSRGLYSQAAIAFEDALAMDGASNSYIYWLNLADAYRQLPDRETETERSYRQAIRMLDTLIESRPTDVRMRSRRALALARSGALETAQEDVEFLRQAGTGGDLYSLFRLAVIEELGGQRERALGTLSEALRAGFSLSDVRLEPDLVALRADPRFHLLQLDLEQES